MRILIFGAGVIGSLYGALLAEAGYDVSVYARGRRLESLTQDGLLYKGKGKIRKALSSRPGEPAAYGFGGTSAKLQPDHRHYGQFTGDQ